MLLFPEVWHPFGLPASFQQLPDMLTRSRSDVSSPPPGRSVPWPARQGSEELYPRLLVCVTGLIVVPVILGYFLDAVGLRLSSAWFVLGLTSWVILTAIVFAAVRPGPYRAQWARIGTAFVVFVLAFAIGLFVAWPSLLPISRSVDAVHHYALIDYIFRHQRLVHGSDEGPNLGEMVGYPFGACLLVAALAQIVRLPPLYLMQPVVALVFAYTALFCYSIVSEFGIDRASYHLEGLVTLPAFLVPTAYTIGQFSRDFYLTQMLGICCLLGLWYWSSYYTRHPDHLPLVPMLGLSFCLVFTYPTLMPPFAAVLLVAPFLGHGLRRWREHLGQLAVVGIPVSLVAVFYLKDRIELGMAIARHEGETISPGLNTIPVLFAVFAAPSLVLISYLPRTRPVALFVWFTIGQTVLFYVAASRGMIAQYTAKKMFFVLSPELSAVVALALLLFIYRAQRVGGDYGTAIAVLLRAAAGLSLLVLVRQGWMGEFQGLDPRASAHPAVSQNLFDCSSWVRANLGGQPIMVFSTDVIAAYWVDVAFLKRARDTFPPANVRTSPEDLLRWSAGGSREHYAVVVGSLAPLEKLNVDTLRRCGQTWILARRG